jgi:hypothetical protein
MQRANDRQRILAAHGVPISDRRLPIQMLDTRHFTAVESRILAHGEDEQSGRRYLMLEGTDAKVHLIYQTQEIEEARSSGGLRTNSFVRLRKLFVVGQPILDVHEFGDAEQFLKNRSVLRENARALLKRGLVPTENGWGGWLGRYQAALADVVGEIMQNRRLRGSASARTEARPVSRTVIADHIRLLALNGVFARLCRKGRYRSPRGGAEPDQ